MVSDPQAFLLMSLPDASLESTGALTEYGVLNLECVSMPNPDSKDSEVRNVYLVLRVNNAEAPIDPARVVHRTDSSGQRIYTFAPSQHDPTVLTLTLKVPNTHNELFDKLEAFDNIVEQYVTDFRGPSSGATSGSPPSGLQTIAGQSTTVDVKGAKKDLRGHLVMINEDTGEVVGEVEDRFRISEDPIMHEQGHENDPVIIEVGEESTRESDANTLKAFARIVPPDQRNWITSSASVVSHAISMTTNLLLTTITAASDLYISRSAPSPHHSANPKSGTKDGTPTPPPLPPRALVFLTSEKTRKGLSTVHTISGEAVKVSSKTVALIDKMIRRAIGAKTKRTKYFPTGVPASNYEGPNTLTAGPPLPARTPSPSSSSAAPPAYAPGMAKSASSSSASSLGPEKPALPPRRSPSPLPQSSGKATTSASAAAAATPPPLPPRLTTKDHILISADLILSTIDDSTRKVLDVGTEQIGRVMGHKYGPEAKHSSLLAAGTARNVGLVYVDMRGIGRRALLKRVGRNYVTSRFSSGKTGEAQPQAQQAQMQPQGQAAAPKQ